MRSFMIGYLLHEKIPGIVIIEAVDARAAAEKFWSMHSDEAYRIICLGKIG